MKKAEITVNISEQAGTISPLLYGHFAEHIGGVIYGGVWVGKDSDIPNIDGFRLDLIEKLKRISPSVIRWPGGCFAETYDWRDGIGNNRPARPSWWTKDDGKYETNEFGTHEFMELCSLVGAKPYLAVNTATLTPMDARHWIDYCNSPRGATTLAAEREKNGSPEPFGVEFIGIGNENWGGGGTMSASQYAMEYRKFSSAIRNIAPKATLVAAGANTHSPEWASIFLDSLKESYGTKAQLDAVALHHYFTGKRDKSFDREDWDTLVESAERTEHFISELAEQIARFGNPKIKIYLDEWGTMFDEAEDTKKYNQPFRQQVTQRDAVCAALTFNILHRYSSIVEMANIAQIANCLSALFLTDGAKLVTTPVYHIFDMYRAHQGAKSLRTETTDSEISHSASEKDGHLLITLVNTSYSDDKYITLNLQATAKLIEATLLESESPDSYNSFDAPNAVSPKKISVDINESIKLPRASVMAISLKI